VKERKIHFLVLHSKVLHFPSVDLFGPTFPILHYQLSELTWHKSSKSSQMCAKQKVTVTINLRSNNEWRCIALVRVAVSDVSCALVVPHSIVIQCIKLDSPAALTTTVRLFSHLRFYYKQTQHMADAVHSARLVTQCGITLGLVSFSFSNNR